MASKKDKKPVIEGDDALSSEQAIKMMMDQLFTPSGPAYNLEIRARGEQILREVEEDAVSDVPEEKDVATIIIVASMVNGLLIPIIETFGTEVVGILLEEMASKYRGLSIGQSNVLH